MKNIFDQDGGFVKYGNMVVNLILASVLWLVTSVPVLTLGASLPALFETVHETVREGKGYVSKTYFRAFLKYARTGWKLWLLQLLAAAVLAVDLWYFRTAMLAERTEGMFFIPMLFLSVFAFGWILMCAWFQTREAYTGLGIKKSLILCLGKMHWTLGISLIFMGAAVCMYLFPVLLLIVPGGLFLGFDAALDKMVL